MSLYKRVAQAGILSFIFISFFATHPVAASTDFSGTIFVDTTWTVANSPYIVNALTINSGAILTIEPGVVVKLGDNATIDVNGTLNALGTTTEKVYFTSQKDDTIGGDSNADGSASTPAPEDWRNIKFFGGSTGNFSNTIIRYAGAVFFSGSAGIFNDGGNVSITDSSITKSEIGVLHLAGTSTITSSEISDQAMGLYLWNGSLDINNSDIHDNSQYGIFVHPQSGSLDLTLTDNTFSNNAVHAALMASVKFNHSGNSASGNGINGWKIGGAVYADRTWSAGDLPYVVDAEIFINTGSTLTLDPGVIMKFQTNNNSRINVDGNLLANGTLTDKVYFTSLADDTVGGDTNGDGDATAPAPGDWRNIKFNGGTSSLSNTVLKYAGFVTFLGNTGIYNSGGNLSISDSVITDNGDQGLFQSGGSSTITSSEFSNQAYGIHRTGGAVDITGSNIKNNSILGVLNSESGTINATNNYWGDPSGPYNATTNPTGLGNGVSAGVNFTPWLGVYPPPQSVHNPVLIVPGIMGSYLNKDDGTEVWMNIPKMLLPGGDSYLNELSLQYTGEPTDIYVEASDIIKKAGNKDYFNGLIEYLETKGYGEDDLYVFPYDWRLDIHTLAISLKRKVEEIMQSTGAQKVDIIAHSMGGLVIKDYLKYFGGNLIDKFIDVGTPHTGAPKSFKILMYGDDLNASILFGLLGLSSERVKFIAQNMPSIYQLLPSPLYGNYLYDMDDLDNNNDRGLLDYGKTKEFVKNTGRNSLLVERADSFHQEIDNLDAANYGVKTFNIVGCGTQTLNNIFIFNKEDSGGVEYIISYINGDGTVPLKSAEALQAQDIYYLKNATHALMPSTSGAKEVIFAILNDENPNLDLYPNLAISSNGCTIPNGKIVSFHSPIDLHIYDSEGNHTGPDTDGGIENNIPGVSYDVIEGNKFAYLPDGQDYIVQGTATASGKFNARVQKIENEIIAETKYYNEIPLNSTTKVEVKENEITIDNNDDGVVDQEFFPSAILDETQSTDITKPDTLLTTDPVGKKGNKFDKPVKISLTAEDDNSGILKKEYSINSDSWLTYSEPLTISTRGETKILYRSTDRAGNVELPKSAIITINLPGNSGKN